MTYDLILISVFMSILVILSAITDDEDENDYYN